MSLAQFLRHPLSCPTERLYMSRSPIRQVLKSKSDATMLFVHMVVARAAHLEDRHTHPADVRLAASTSHMIASHCLLHWRRAVRTTWILSSLFSLSSAC